MPARSARLLSPFLAAGLLGLAVTSAPAQGYDPYGNNTPYSSAPNETVTVIGPHFRADSTPLNGPLERVSLSKPVHYTTRDLVDPRRAQELRWRVGRAAHEVCQSLAESYPVYPMSTAPTCFREAYNDAIVKIDARITGARLAYWYGY
jgi:UrcA family protein